MQLSNLLSGKNELAEEAWAGELLEGDGEHAQ